MRLYSGSSKQFIDDTVRNQIAQKLSDAFFYYYRYHPSPGEKRSWQNSLSKMSELIHYAKLTDHGVMLEFQLPQSSKRLSKDIPKAPLWAYNPNGINQIGCIYTAQGFEFDYVRVIFGNDLVYDFEKQEWIAKTENFGDSEVKKKSGDKLADYLKNIYRVLLTRGLKGCYVYFMDKQTENFVKSRIEFSNTKS